MNTDSGVRIENYQAGNGFLDNRQNIQAVYAFYQKLFVQNQNFLWAGLAKLAGAPVYAGLSDAEHVITETTNLVTTNGVDAEGISNVVNYVQSIETNLIQMNIDIMNDLTWQFEAYKYGGLQALQTIDAADPSHTIKG